MLDHFQMIQILAVNDQDPGVRLIDNMPEKLTLIAGVDRDFHRSDFCQAEPDIDKIRTIGEHDADLIPLSDPQIQKGVGAAIGESVQFIIGDPFFLESQENLAGVPFYPVGEQITQDQRGAKVIHRLLLSLPAYVWLISGLLPYALLMIHLG